MVQRLSSEREVKLEDVFREISEASEQLEQKLGFPQEWIDEMRAMHAN